MLPLEYRPIAYAVFPETCQIQHQHSGIAFRYSSGGVLELLSPANYEREYQTLTALGARAVLDSWPKGSLKW